MTDGRSDRSHMHKNYNYSADTDRCEKERVRDRAAETASPRIRRKRIITCCVVLCEE